MHVLNVALDTGCEKQKQIACCTGYFELGVLSSTFIGNFPLVHINISLTDVKEGSLVLFQRYGELVLSTPTRDDDGNGPSSSSSTSPPSSPF
jgi:hypothetical protein